ncbi:helix-turn-helix domain-containing protein [Saccharospirillum mangrovi]|uniref:helix-turn-helix domain-containing protein n=1 Tax=Saccharospirillum mangrovi TaxID=2161747 RepID=UPI00130050B6|nr:helix-turn-helix domain-containing protein [Saccharospirillum mangrovi]
MFEPQAPPTEVFLAHQGEPPDYATIEETLADQIGQNLRSVRSHLGLGQRGLSERMQISLSQYRKYEAGRDLPRLHSALLWSLETGLPTHWLFYGTRYQQWLQLPFKPAWVPVLYFVNRAPDWALEALHSVLRGLLRDYSTETNPFVSVAELRSSLSAGLLRDPYYRSVSEKLRDFRLQREVSQEEVARLMGVSLAAYKKYETPELCPHYSVNMIMRFWMATGTSPLSLSKETPVYLYRQAQNANFAILLPWLERLDEAGLARVNEVSRVLAEPA